MIPYYLLGSRVKIFLAIKKIIEEFPDQERTTKFKLMKFTGMRREFYDMKIWNWLVDQNIVEPDSGGTYFYNRQAAIDAWKRMFEIRERFTIGLVGRTVKEVLKENKKLTKKKAK